MKGLSYIYTYGINIRNGLFVLCAIALVLLIPYSASAGLLERFAPASSSPNPLSQLNPPRFDERVLSEEKQLKRNRISTVAFKTATGTNIALIITGFLPFPTVQTAAEISQIALDTGLKFSKASLYEPNDKFVNPSTECGYEFTLPQTKVDYSNAMGLWPKLGDDLLLIKNGVATSDRFYPRIPLKLQGNSLPFLDDIETDFGILGKPEIYHVDTDVILSVDGPTAGISRDGGAENGYDAQDIEVPIGVHVLEWRADTQYRPIWDTIMPSAMIPIMMGVEAKFAKHIKKLKKWRGGAIELGHTVGDPDAVYRLVKRLDRQIKLVERLKKLTKKVIKKGVGEVKGLTTAMIDPVTTVQRSRNQILTVYDPIPPSLSTNETQLTREATDIGGASSSRYIDEMQSVLVFSDNCDRAVLLSHDAPGKFPLGDTVVTWTARDLGPAPPEMDPDGNGRLETTVTQTITIEDTRAPIIVPPPAVVDVGSNFINLNDYDLGQPLVVDLVDLHPDVVSSTDGDGTVDPGTRAIVTWTATDDSLNENTAQQMVTLKALDVNDQPINTAPVADNNSVETLTSKPVPIILTATDPDVLPFMNGDPGIPDPLQFKIEQPPSNGEFIAPLLPFFIDDYRTDTTGVLSDDLAFAEAGEIGGVGQLSWLENEYCDGNGPLADEIPVNFVFNPLFVHVTDEGEQYFIDHYAVCEPNGIIGEPADQFMRISRWDKDRNYIGQFDYNPGGGTHTSSFIYDRNGKIYYLRSFGVNEFNLQECDSGIVGNVDYATACGGVKFNDPPGSVSFDISRSKFARVDSTSDNSQDILIYLTDGNHVNIYRGQVNEAGKLTSAGYWSQLTNDAGNPDFLGKDKGFVGNCSPISGGGGNQAHGMEVDSEGNFYITDSCRHRIHKFSRSTIDSNNNLVQGEYIGWMGQCSTSTNLACDDANQRSKGFSCTDTTCTVNNTVNIDGSGDNGWGTEIGQFNNPVYLAMDANDILYVADYSNQSIQRFDQDGTFAGQAKSTGNGINADTDGSFVLGNMGPPRHVSVNLKQFFVVDQGEKFVHVFETSPFTDVSDNSATVTYVSNFAFHSDTDTFTYSVNDGLVDSNIAQVSINVARNYRQPLPTTQSVKVNEDGEVVIVISGTDPDGILNRDFNGLDSLSFVIKSQPVHGKLTPGGETDVVLDPGMSVWTYIPDQDYHGNDSFSFTVRDAFTDESFDGATPKPEPYGEADAASVDITIESINDIPILEITPPERIAAGFPIMLGAFVEDDTGEEYFFELDWGDGAVDYNGEVIVDNNDTPNDRSDDTTTITGVIFSSESLESIGAAPANAYHLFTDVANRNIHMCVKDDGNLETCESIEVQVENLVVLSVDAEVPDVLITDGNIFSASITVVNEQPMGGVTGLDADNVNLTVDVPPELVVNNVTTSQGTCSVADGVLGCSFGTIVNANSVTVDLLASGNNSLVNDKQLFLSAVISTDTLALSDQFSDDEPFILTANTFDADSDGLSSAFELFYGVSDPAADDDGDGLDNLAEQDADTSPIASDTDGDGINDKDELNTYGSNPLEADSDGDELSDGDEINLYKTDPLSTDSDGDSLPDKWEIDNGFNPIVADSSGDADGDGLTDGEEYLHGTDYQLADSDGDGLTDSDEINLYSIDPLNADTDNDGLDDGAELAQTTDPLKPDTDFDGLKDGEEINVYFTQPLLTDTDRDSLPDGWEIKNDRNPLIADYQLDAGGLSSCALTDAGVECWGRNDFGQAPALVGGLVNPGQITVGFVHACALDVELDASRSVKCWGSNSFGQRTVPALIDPIQVSAGAYHTCALDQVSPGVVEVKCWGRDNFLQVSSAPTNVEQPVRLVSSISGSSSCVMDEKTTGPELICWGQYNNSNSTIPSGLTSSSSAFALGSEHGCIVDNGNRLCWGLNDDGQAPPGPSSSAAVQLSLGGFHSCSLDPVNPNQYGVNCWGLNDDGQATVPSTLIEPIQLASGSRHSCALDQGNARCWGVETNFDQGQAPANKILGIDPDNDGVPTGQEILDGTDPLDPDSDRDQLNDGQEKSLGTDPLNADTDDDGVSDADEINVHATDPNNADSDNDGMADGWELDNGLQPTINDAAADNDGDSLNNGQEFIHNTNPNMADTDDDGLSDSAELTIFRYVDGGQALGSSISEAVKLGDLDGDDDLDAFFANSGSNSTVWLNDGAGNFSLSVDNTLNNFDAADVDFRDTDGDDDLDALLVHSDNTQSNTLWLNGENGDPQGQFSNSGMVFDAVILDNNAAEFGTLDSLTPSTTFFAANTGANRAFAVDKNGFFLLDFIDPLNADSKDVAVGDLNGDQLIDAVFVNSDAQNQVFTVNSPSEYSQNSLFGAAAANRTAVALGDIDGDEILDVYEAISGSADHVWINNGNGIFNDSGQSLGNDNVNDVNLVDFDRDGDLDAILANTGANKIWLNNGTGTLSDSGLSLGSATSLGLSTGDVDGDGDTDIIFANNGANAVWLLEQLDPNNPDSDGDGVFDGWEVTHGFDPLDNSDATLDTDVDGLNNYDEFLAGTDPNIADSDGDGMPDGWEKDFGLDPTSDDSLGDIDGDGLNNLAEYQQNLTPQADDVPPVMDVPTDVTVNSTGTLTAVNTGVANATDAKTATVIDVDNPGPFVTGRNMITWSAADLYGNAQQGTQNVNVIPLINFAIDQVTAEGATAQATIQLNGEAVNYPVDIGYTVSGVATSPDDHDAINGSATINSGTTTTIPINIVDDGIPEGNESFTLTINTANNAVVGNKPNHTLTIAEQNITPTAAITIVQQGIPVTTVAIDSGPITISTIITDPNPADTHSVDWSGSDAAMFDPADFSDDSYTIDPASLATGIYSLRLGIADNGVPVALNTASARVSVVATAPALSFASDVDGDGVSDADEGAGDSDSDGVADYLDATNANNLLTLNEQGYMLETQTGLRLRLGEQAFTIGSIAAVSEPTLQEEAVYDYPNGVVDFEILGVEPGGSANVVVPLRFPLPATALYRKYITNTWQNFVIDSNNVIASAPGGEGACPPPGSSNFITGLNEGDSCVQLTLEDGGPNDSDALANGVIVDPGGVAVVAEVTIDVLPVSDQTIPSASTNVVLTALRLTNNLGGVELRSLTVDASGTGSDQLVSTVNVFVDSNNNGSVDAGDIAIGNGTYLQDNGVLTLQITPAYALPPGQTSLLVTYDF